MGLSTIVNVFVKAQVNISDLSPQSYKDQLFLCHAVKYKFHLSNSYQDYAIYIIMFNKKNDTDIISCNFQSDRQDKWIHSENYNHSNVIPGTSIHREDQKKKQLIVSFLNDVIYPAIPWLLSDLSSQNQEANNSTHEKKARRSYMFIVELLSD